MKNEKPDFLEILNQYGAPLKKRVISEIEAVDGFTVASEEYAVALGNVKSAVDILAYRKDADRLLVFTIECKRALAPYKQWVFFTETATHTYSIGRCFRKTSIMSFGSHRNWLPDIEFCSDGVEISTNRNRERKVNSEAVYKAASQATTGYLGFLNERMPTGAPLPELPDHPLVVVLPLIVTTADLWVCDSDNSSVDLSTGLLTDLQASKVPWLAYRFPSHPGTTDQSLDFRATDPMQNYVLTCVDFPGTSIDQYKETIYVVNSKNIGHFLTEQVPQLLNKMV